MRGDFGRKLTNLLANYQSFRRTYILRNKLKLIICAILPILAVMALYSTSRCAIVWGNEVVAVANSRQEAVTVVTGYLSGLEEVTGMPVKLNEEIKYRPTWRYSAAVDAQEMKRLLAKKINFNFGATGIFVDGQMVVAVRDTATGQQVLDSLLGLYGSSQREADLSFKQKVELKPVDVKASELMETDRAVEYIRFGGNKVRKYEIKEGDTLWDIASAGAIDVEELQNVNPGLKPETMQIGQEIIISQTSPLVDVLTTYQVTVEEDMSFRVKESNDSNLYWGEQKLVQQGVPGQREVVYQITQENGVEVNKKAVQAKVIKEPVPQIIAKGEKKLLAFRGGNNRLAYPASGAIVSSFGQRWGRMHEGVDISANHGSPVVAAEAGTIQHVGYKGGYGLRIDINHGGGVVTRYAHLSSTAVKSGQRVERGQFIGRAGSSGNSTGPHLHFEVMVNGVHKNPSLFI